MEMDKDSSINSEQLANTPLRVHRKTSLWSSTRDRLFSFDETPAYLRDNPFIIQHYRGELSFRKAIQSVFSFHNETVNIWSHILGFLLFVALWVAFAFSAGSCPSPKSREMHCRVAHRWPVYVFFGTSCLVLLVSVAAHVLYCVSQRAYKLMWKLDYTGIIVCLASLYIPSCLLVFSCESLWIPVTYIAIAWMLAILSIVFSQFDSFQAHQIRHIRFSMFAMLPLLGVAPIAHSCFILWSNASVRSAMVKIIVDILLLFGGGSILLLRLPEKWFPGLFDLVGHSHNVWHFAILGALILFYSSIMDLYGYASG
jgi:adiponectin receptor